MRGLLNTGRAKMANSNDKTEVWLLADEDGNYQIATKNGRYYLNTKENNLMINVMKFIISVKDDTGEEVLRYDRANHIMKSIIDLKETNGDYDNAW